MEREAESYSRSVRACADKLPFPICARRFPGTLISLIVWTSLRVALGSRSSMEQWPTIRPERTSTGRAFYGQVDKRRGINGDSRPVPATFPADEKLAPYTRRPIIG
jgi:hypothetical protein